MAALTEAAIKRERLMNYMAAKKLNAVALTQQRNFAWYTCGGDSHVASATESGVATLVITKKRQCLVTANIEAQRLIDEEVRDEFEIITHPWHEGARRGELIRKIIGKGKAASDDGAAGLPLLAPDFAELRFLLTPAEVERYRWLGRIASEIMTYVCCNIEPGMTENEIEAELNAVLICKRITPTVVLIAADDRIKKYRHPIVTEKPVKKSAMVVLCARRWGLVCSLTRLVHFGKLPAQLAARHAAAAEVDAAFILGTTIGRPVAEIFKEAQAVYARHGFAEEWRLHHQGGAAGYAEREYIVTPGDQRRVQPNQAFAWNPSITGTKSEDTIIATEAGPEVISAPRQWPLLDVEYQGMKIQRAAILEK
jgi:Xaa-Pro aminopeptidase